MGRVYNFSAGPAVLPEEVLQEAAAEMLDYQGSGMSVMEMSHRSKVYDTIIKEAEADLRELMNIPDNYKVLFLQGGASQQFAMIPMNLMKNKKADYIVTGQSSTVRLTLSLLVLTKHFLTFQTVLIFQSMMMPTMFISAKTTLSTAPNSTHFQIQREKHL